LPHAAAAVGLLLSAVPAGSAVFTRIGALGTPSRTGPSLESIFRLSVTVDLCEGYGRKLAAFIAPLSATRPISEQQRNGQCTTVCKLTRYALLRFVRSRSSINNKIISLIFFISLQPVGGPQKEKKIRGPGHVPSVPNAHWLRRPCRQDKSIDSGRHPAAVAPQHGAQQQIALSSKCEQCRVHSRRMKLNTVCVESQNTAWAVCLGWV